jgi:hypothetical protein
MMAAQLEAELVGVFVEDANLVRLAALPCSSEVGFASARARTLNRGTVERTFKHLAADARRALITAAERAQVKWSFEVARGSVVGEALRAVQKKKTGARANSAMASDPAGSVVLLQAKECKTPKGKALIVMDGSHISLRALPTALELAGQSCTKNLLLLVISDSVFEARAQIRRARRLIESEGENAAVHGMGRAAVNDLLALAANEGCGTLIFSACAGLLSADQLTKLVEGVDYPVFVVA